LRCRRRGSAGCADRWGGRRGRQTESPRRACGPRRNHAAGVHQLTGPARRTFVSFVSPSGEQFASDFVPPKPVPSLGAIKFSDDGKLIGVGFQPMFNASGSEAIIVTGVMVCHYPKKNGKR
jgi:hypothetical protein